MRASAMREKKESDVEAVKRALRAYGARLGVKCPSCGAEVGERCTSVGGTARRQLDVPHATRKAEGP